MKAKDSDDAAQLSLRTGKPINKCRMALRTAGGDMEMAAQLVYGRITERQVIERLEIAKAISQPPAAKVKLYTPALKTDASPLKRRAAALGETYRGQKPSPHAQRAYEVYTRCADPIGIDRDDGFPDKNSSHIYDTYYDTTSEQGYADYLAHPEKYRWNC